MHRTAKKNKEKRKELARVVRDNQAAHWPFSQYPPKKEKGCPPIAGMSKKRKKKSSKGGECPKYEVKSANKKKQAWAAFIGKKERGKDLGVKPMEPRGRPSSKKKGPLERINIQRTGDSGKKVRSNFGGVNTRRKKGGSTFLVAAPLGAKKEKETGPRKSERYQGGGNPLLNRGFGRGER